MIAVSTTQVLWLLLLAAVSYAAWTVYYLSREGRRGGGTASKDGTAPGCSEPKKHKDIVGKSRFVLPPRSHSEPLAATGGKEEKPEKKPNIFVPEQAPEHPRQIPPDELDDVFGAVPEGESNDPLDIELPPDQETFPDNEADYFNDGDDENEDLPFTGNPSAQGISFDQLGDAYRQMVHNPIITEQQKEETGRVFLHLKDTDMLGAMVSGKPEREERVTSLIDTYLSAFHRRMMERSAESLSPQGDFPEDFDVRQYE